MKEILNNAQIMVEFQSEDDQNVLHEILATFTMQILILIFEEYSTSERDIKLFNSFYTITTTSKCQCVFGLKHKWCSALESHTKNNKRLKFALQILKL